MDIHIKQSSVFFLTTKWLNHINCFTTVITAIIKQENNKKILKLVLSAFS